MQAILLAAGFGTRLRPYTLIKPKPLFPVLNRPLIHILIDKLRMCGCSTIVVNSHHLADQIERALCKYTGILIQYEPEILGTGGALRKAIQRLRDEPLLVMNADVYHHIDLEDLYRVHSRSAGGVTMAIHDYPRFNNVAVHDGQVVGFHRSARSDCRAFTGVHIVDPEIIEMIPMSGFFHIIDLYKNLADRGRLHAYDTGGRFWSDIGTPQDYLALNAHLLSESKVEPAWLVHESAQVEEGVRLEEWGVIGPEATICRGACLRASVVWEGTVVPADRRIVDTVCCQGYER